MKIESSKNSYHLNYCTNIHPGEIWKDVFHNLQKETLHIYKNFEAGKKGIGLRLSAKAVKEGLKDLKNFNHWLDNNQFYISTINAFPYGEFHQERVKENVYLPDWSQPERVEYTKDIIHFLSQCHTDQVCTISTVPIGWKDKFANQDLLEKAVNNIKEVLNYLDEVNKDCNKLITLAFEPEPGCFLENKSDVINFFTHYLYSEQYFNLNERNKAKELLGICFDTCHFAVMFEDSIESIIDIEKSNISVFKYQISSGLKYRGNSRDFLQAIDPFIDGIYLHQVAIKEFKGKQLIKSFSDIDEIPISNEEFEFRVHFHVPIFMNHLHPFEGTNDFIKDVIDYIRDQKREHILEVETYTFNVLPQKYKMNNMNENIERELKWLAKLLT